MITCNLSKPEATLDQVRKTHEKLSPTDAALIASALVLAGRYAIANYDGRAFSWPENHHDLASALRVELEQLMEHFEAPTKKTKTAPEEEPVELKLSLSPNYTAGQSMLGDRKDLKTLLSDLIAQGVEYVYTPADIGWQWALDRVNWNTLSDGAFTRRVKLKTVFEGDTVGVEVGSSAPKRRASKKPVVEAHEPAE